VTQPHDHPSSVRDRLDAILPTVERPARYLGLEPNAIRKPWSQVAVRTVLAFPDTYEIGMSHQGTRILYHLINRRADGLAERAFMPWPDMADALRASDTPLYSLESYRPLAEFDLVGISLQTELDFINVPHLMRLAKLPVRARERDDRHPLIVGGGPCTANPEPLADLFDAFLIGDAEDALDTVLDTVRDAKAAGISRGDLLTQLSGLPGVYVPAFVRWDPAAGHSSDLVALPVPRVWTPSLSPDTLPDTPLLPVAEIVQDRLAVEIMRGCTQGCRFCQAGYWYRPVRERPPDEIIEHTTTTAARSGADRVGLLSLSTADYSQISPLVNQLSDQLSPQQVSIGLPSLRADTVSVELARAVSSVRKSGLTFAPETGSERLRNVINKRVSDADLEAAAEAAFAAGWRLIKLYAMIGLPTETDADLEALVDLARRLAAIGRRHHRKRAEVKLSVGCFVPKPWTPFQWQPFTPVAELQRRIDLLRDQTRSLRGVRLTWSDPRLAAHEALLARGDRSLAAAIIYAAELGAALDGWSDQLRPDLWDQALATAGIDLERELGERPLDAKLAWQVINPGVTTGFLKAELRRAKAGLTTEDCRTGRCLHCGIPGDGDDRRLATPPADPPARRQPSRSSPSPKRPGGPRRRCRVVFQRTGDARFLSHRLAMDSIERALRASGAPVLHTEGYNPHIRLSMCPPLPLGHEGLRELLDVDCRSPLRPHHLEHTNRFLPSGLRLLDSDELLPGAPSLGKAILAAVHRVQRRKGQPWPTEPLDETALQALEGLRDGIRGWKVEEHTGDLLLELNARQSSGPTPSVKKILAALGVEPDEIARARVIRERFLLGPAEAKANAR
jgi:radical SAM family uncharacterized protein/radical SAM-linked protein